MSGKLNILVILLAFKAFIINLASRIRIQSGTDVEQSAKAFDNCDPNLNHGGDYSYPASLEMVSAWDDEEMRIRNI
jgi:hypothetical protein